jgi:hypothetical protein
MAKINLSRDDLQKITSVLQSFPDVNFFELKQYGQSGIGSLLDISFNTEVNSVTGKLTVSISNESSW